MRKSDIGLNCPKCGQFMGPSNLCPYCRTRVKNRLDINTLKAISLLVSVLGVASLLVWAHFKDHGQWDIEDLSKKQNYAFLEFEGVVVEDPRYYVTFTESGDSLPGSVSFKIDDGTGLIEVKAYQEVAKEIVREKKIPSNGDRVRVAGSVTFRGRDMSVMLQDVSLLEILTEDPDLTINIRDIHNKGEDANLSGKRVKVTGTFPGIIKQERDHNVGLQNEYNTLILLIDEDKYYVCLKIPSALEDAYREKNDARVDSEISLLDDENAADISITVEGNLVWDRYASAPNSEYWGSWVIVPRSLDDVRLEVAQ